MAEYDATLYNFFNGSKYSSTHGYNDEIVKYVINGETKVLPKAVVKLLELIFDKPSIEKFFYDNSGITNVVSQVFSSYLLGGTISALVGGGVPNILHDLFLMTDAREIIKEFANDQNAIYRYYMKLNTKIRPLEKNCDEFKKIVEFVKNSHGPTHSKYCLEVMEVFKISRCGEFKKYEKHRDSIKHKKLLWHGSRTANFASILMKGLQIAPSNAQRTGSMFGEGIYFADIATKSANYCNTDKNNQIGVVLLAEVATGESLILTKAKKVTSLPNGINSVKAVGKYAPNQSFNILSNNNVEISMGKPVLDSSLSTVLDYNEYVVYNPDQVLLQYLVQLKFNYK